jgi:hypothetical protein
VPQARVSNVEGGALSNIEELARAQHSFSSDFPYAPDAIFRALIPV